ncbi:MAG: hypothetical protein F4Z52_00770 [Gammaproteobacteria bacterium]|nr:hypothetical protein [Gammaproteobacteria bacterium]
MPGSSGSPGRSPSSPASPLTECSPSPWSSSSPPSSPSPGGGRMMVSSSVATLPGSGVLPLPPPPHDSRTSRATRGAASFRLIFFI